MHGHFVFTVLGIQASYSSHLSFGGFSRVVELSVFLFPKLLPDLVPYGRSTFRI